ncbi:nuclease [Bordetella ansorpii]|uniref:Nuclease n=1 Tax=Bordetella ansorpii TaxID=288768 RepID=A0A157SPZ6_9BORD|nr:thermonuclease family protein [Bordetella ansorpii]SAI72487.1 nuclease [Bordetella ansorpii]
MSRPPASRPGRRGRNRNLSIGGAVAALVLTLAGTLLHRYLPSGDRAEAPARGSQQQRGEPYTLRGQVSDVADGDTVTLATAQGPRKIRLDSIDAPETGHGPGQPGQPFGEASRKHLASMVAGRRLSATCFESDPYDRHVCTLNLEDGSSANRAQVSSGYAWAYTARRGAYLRDKEMTRLQKVAREARQGLWSQPGAIEPWKWRYDCWRQRQCG